jgi:hypothetical protein
LKRSSILTFVLALAPVYATTVLSNNPAPGDSYTNAGNSNQGQAVGSTGWYYNNTRFSGTVGINSNYARSGNGSVEFTTPGSSAKADIEYLAGGVNLGGNYYATSSLGSFSLLTSFGYDWYLSSSSTTSNLHPALRVLLDADGDLNTITDRGYLIYERAYNGNTFPTDAWQTDTVGAQTYLWNTGLGLGFAANINQTPYAYDATLAEWQAYLPNAVILGFSVGVGSGWSGVFAGAIDNVNWQIGTEPAVMNNFEVARGGAVPEPSTYMMAGSALALALFARRRR